MLTGCILALLVTACDRGRGPTPPEPAPTRSSESPQLAEPDPLGAVSFPRPGPGDVDRALLPRLRRGLDLPLQIAVTLRSSDAWLVVYTYDENEAWWRALHREGKIGETIRTLSRRRRQCEAAYRSPEEDEADPSTAEDDPGKPEFELNTEDGMEQRTCWELAMASLAAREGPLDDPCDAIGVARVSADKVESLWRSTGSCADAPAAFELLDVAGAGWPQLILQYRDTYWGSTRMGFQAATVADHLVVLDPRPGHAPEMLDETLSSEQQVDETWQFYGSLAHVAFSPGCHVTRYRQDWTTTQEDCQPGPDGWIVDTEVDEDQDDSEDDWPSCTFEWLVTRTAWDAKTEKWSGAVKTMPEPTRPPKRDLELPIDLTPTPAKQKPRKKKKK